VQFVAYAFAHHCPLLARYRFQILFDSRIERASKCGVEARSARPIAPAPREIAQFEHRDGEHLHQPDGLAFQGASAVVIGCDRPAMHGKCVRYQRRTEQQRLHMGERQDTGNNPAALRNQVIGRMAEGPFEDPLPSGKMKKRSVRVTEHELVPALLVAGSERPYGEACLRSVQDVMTGNRPPPSLRKSRSMRVQIKFLSKRRSRGSVRSRFR
jgi:hypothetical protein